MKLLIMTSILVAGATFSCQEKRSSTRAAAEVREAPAIESKPALPLTKDRGGVSQNLVRSQGGDQLPVVVDPESPGSCALVAHGERCGYCCGDVFIDESERWYQCMNACAKHENSGHEY